MNDTYQTRVLPLENRIAELEHITDQLQPVSRAAYNFIDAIWRGVMPAPSLEALVAAVNSVRATYHRPTIDRVRLEVMLRRLRLVPEPPKFEPPIPPRPPAPPSPKRRRQKAKKARPHRSRPLRRRAWCAARRRQK